MKRLKILLAFFTLCLLFVKLAFPVEALQDPMSTPNNKFGIHILFPDELSDAAKLVNTNGGDWGYVTIPIQAGEKDLTKWQKFMDIAERQHIIPLVRLASEGDFFNTKVWRKPNENDVLDFANFLNSLHWPTKNRYIIVFNEVNRGDEWGGSPDPKNYAELLSYAVTVFKSKSQDFFIISSGMDNAAANSSDTVNEYTFFRAMNASVPGIFSQVDGFASHSYPNPGFIQPPNLDTSENVMSFSHEEDVIKNMSNKTLPVFITETGWDDRVLPQSVIASYYQIAFDSIWNDKSVVAVTPFLLRAGGGPFVQFSFLDSNNKPTLTYQKIVSMPKTKGQPPLSEKVLGEKAQTKVIQEKKFQGEKERDEIGFLGSQPVKAVLKWMLHL